MEISIMLFSQTQKINKHQMTRTNSKKPLVPACLGLAFIFSACVFMSGCVVHHPGHGVVHHPGHGYKKGHGHHKGHIKIKPKMEISVSPMIVIDD